MNRGPLKYKLQLQLHEAKEDDPPILYFIFYIFIYIYILYFHIAREWDEATHPWLDLADVTMTTLLSPLATDELEFNFKNLPPSLDSLPARSADDPNVVVHIRRDVYSFSQKLRAMRRDTKALVPDDAATYVIRVFTGCQSATTTAPSIKIALTGE